VKKYFITGLLILVPLAITFWVLRSIVTTMDQVLLLLPPSWREDLFILRIPGVGVLATIAVVFLVGLLARNFIGRQLVGFWEQMLAHIPIVRSIYSSVKQVSDTILTPNGQAFRKAVLVEYPRKGIWTIGFALGSPGAETEGNLAKLGVQGELHTVFVPTAPNPTSGFILIFPHDQIHELDMSVDAALKFVISLGVVKPGSAAEASSDAMND
jgi:uncharacterized membrane protein